ncbi:MAG TPA: IclR family transcriptional regulator C-terminal domain-containing protein [Halanaerobiales bacterium]|nr:IclR family transcriptional regulator C-terminal domain-containing protein [Halanaerobiales bacterium]
MSKSNKVQSVRMFASPGSKGPAYCTGAGKVLLSYFDKRELEKYIKETEFIPYTDHTITDPDKLKKEFKEIRLQGYALDLEERERGVRCVAAPITAFGDKIVGAISVSGPGTRLSMNYLKEKLIPLVRREAVKISNKLSSDRNSQ